MKSVSKNTQQIWCEHQSKNSHHLLDIPPFPPKTQSQVAQPPNCHSRLLDLFDLGCMYCKPDGHKRTHGEPKDVEQKAEEHLERGYETWGRENEPHQLKSRSDEEDNGNDGPDGHHLPPPPLPHSVTMTLMSLLIRYAHIPFYFRFSFTFPTLPIHHYAPLLQCDCTRLHLHSLYRTDLAYLMDI